MPFLCAQDCLTHAPDYRVNSTGLHMRGRGPVLLRAAAGERLNKVSHLLQVLRSEGRRPSFPHPRFHMREGLALLSHPQALRAHLPTSLQTESALILLPRSGIEPPLLSASAGEEQRYFGQPYPPCLHQGQGGSPDTWQQLRAKGSTPAFPHCPCLFKSASLGGAENNEEINKINKKKSASLPHT